MNYLELAFLVVCVVVLTQALGRRLPLPLAGLQIFAGVALSAVVAIDDLSEITSLLFVMLVPPLLYIEAWQIPKRELLRAIKPVLGMAIGLVTITIAAIGFGLHALFPELPLAMAFALAAALSSTDAVAVSNFTGKMRLPSRLQILLSGESLLNDSVALVAFKVAVVAAVTAQFSVHEAAVSLVMVSAGGLAIGALVAFVANGLRRLLASHTSDGIRIDTILSLLIPYSAYLISDKLAVSGVLAVVAAGLCGGMLDRRHLNAVTRLNGIAIWSTVTLVLSGAVFVMLGLEMPHVLQRIDGYTRSNLLIHVALLTLTVFGLRLGWTLLLAWWSRRHSGVNREQQPGMATWVVAVLCGVRGSLALSATLSIPVLTANGTPMPGRDLAVFLCAATIAATLLVSALLIPLLKVRASCPDPRVLGALDVQKRIARAALRVIDSDPLTAVSSRVHDWAATWRRLFESRLAALDAGQEPQCVHRRDLAAQRQLSMNVLGAQRRELLRLQLTGLTSHELLQELQIDLDLAEIALAKLDRIDSDSG